MNIVFYSQPFISKDIPQNLVPYHISFISKWLSNLTKYAQDSNQEISIKLITSEIIKSKYHKDNRYLSIDNLELINIFGSYEEYLRELKKSSSIKMNILSSKVERVLGNFIPDIIVGCSTNIKFLKKSYPKSVLLFHEAGIFNYTKFAYYTQFLENIDYKESFLKYSKHQNYYNNKIEKFINDFSKKVSSDKQLKTLYQYVRSSSNRSFKKYVLFALQRWNSELMQIHTDFSSEIEYIYTICQKISKDVGIIITMHRSSSIVADKDVQDFLTNKFPNLIFINDTNNPSLYLMTICNAVITTSSTVGFYTAIFNKNLLVPSKTSYLNHIAQTNKIDDFNYYIENEKDINKLSIAVFLVQYFLIPSNYMSNGEWLYKRLKTITLNRSGVTEIKNIDTIIDSIDTKNVNDKTFYSKIIRYFQGK